MQFEIWLYPCFKVVLGKHTYMLSFSLLCDKRRVWHFGEIIRKYSYSLSCWELHKKITLISTLSTKLETISFAQSLPAPGQDRDRHIPIASPVISWCQAVVKGIVPLTTVWHCQRDSQWPKTQTLVPDYLTSEWPEQVFRASPPSSYQQQPTWNIGTRSPGCYFDKTAAKW